MKLAIDIDWSAKPLKLECPYYECHECKYVGEEVHPSGDCPECGVQMKDTATPWPTNKWFSAVDDLVFLYNNEKLELATIAAASYFEGCLHALLFNAMYLICPKTRWKPQTRPVAQEMSITEHIQGADQYGACVAEINRVFKKHRSQWSRSNELCPKVFGATFDSLVAEHVCDYQAFITNRDNIHQWRNQLLHAGFPMTEVLSEEVKARSLKACVEFMMQCWEVFRTLQNELMSKVLLERKRSAET